MLHLGVPSKSQWRCQSNANLSLMEKGTPGSGCKLTPLSQRDRAVLLEVGTTGELTVEVEVVVDRSVDGGELFQELRLPEFCHLSLPSSKRLV